MAALVLDDAAQNFRKNTVGGSAGQYSIAFQCAEFLNGAPTEVRPCQMWCDLADQRSAHFFDSFPDRSTFSNFIHAASRQRHSTNFQKLPQSPSMKQFFISPAGQECRNVGVFNGTSVEQTPQVHDGVRLHVHHVDQTSDLVSRQWMLPCRGEFNS